MFYSAALTGVVMICSFLFWAACKQDSYELVSAFLSPGVWWRSQETWRCPSPLESPGYSQPTQTFPCSVSDWSTPQGSITSCQIKSCCTGQLPSACLFTTLFETVTQSSPSCRLRSDPSQSDPDTRDFWFNMQALQLYLQREAELNPQASYYNIALLKYQVRIWNPYAPIRSFLHIRAILSTIAILDAVT